MKSKTQDFHTPVLLTEVVSFLNIQPGKNYIDATAGGGGHTKKILAAGGVVLAIDVDIDAVLHLKNKFKTEVQTGELQVEKGNFASLFQIAKGYNFEKVSGILFDLGLSSHQIEDVKRGFSFASPILDMRADQDLKVTARELVNNLDYRRLYEIFKKFGEERFTGRIADAIISARKIAPIQSAKELAEIIAKVKPKEKTKIHPATKAFQALRIVVNSELANLEAGLAQAAKLLEVGGRLVVIAYHSLEDGIIKDFFRKSGELVVITQKPIRPSLAEITQNPKARSAKLRVAEKCQQ